MRFGLIIRGQYPQGDDMRVRLKEDLDAAKRAEELGYDIIGKGSHYSSYPFQYIQQIPYLCQVAMIAPKLRLCPGVVLLPLHSPLHVAEELGSLDVMCDGKLVFGAGIGYREVEFNAFGSTQKQSGPRFEECLTAVKRLWSEEFVSMDGSYFKLDNANCTTKPVQKPMPPVWIGANANVGIRRAARMADTWFINPHNKIDTIAEQMEVYKRALDDCGKPFPDELPMAREVFVAKDRAEAIRLAKPSLEAKYKAYKDWGQDKVMPSGDAFSVDFEELMNDRFLFGSPNEVVEQILVLKRRFGINTLILGIHWVGMPASLAMEQMQLISEEVFPLFVQPEKGLFDMKIGAVMFFTTDSMQPAALGRALEERGFESLWVPEHTHVPSTRLTPYIGGGPLPRPYYDIYDPFLALNAAAAVTTTLKIGTGIALVVQRDPIVTAKMVSTIDQISQGRFLLGVGNGWNRDEIENHGTAFGTRNKLARERIEAMQAIWTQDEPSYEGEFVKFGPMSQWPKPFQKPYPPIIVGGAFPHAARRAIRYGNGWIPRADRLEHEGVGVVIKQFREMAVEAGRDPGSLPITIFRVPDDLVKLRFCQEVGIDRVVFSLPAEKEDVILPILDRWVEVKRELGV